MSVHAATAPTRRAGSLRVPRFLKSARGVVGLTMLLFVVVVALIGPLVAAHPLDRPIGVPGAPPGGDAPLGTDFLGRDVLSRVLHGGLQLLVFSALAVVLEYLVGVIVGMVAGFSRSWLGSLLMRAVDLFISIPAILLLLILVTGAGSSNWVLVIGIAAVGFPGIARLVRTATLEVSVAGYVEAAVARGERPAAVMRREILPNIMPSLIADAGLRSVWALYLMASLAFLGFGASPPAANWGLMIAENRSVIGVNIFGILAPAGMIAFLAIGINLLGEAYVASLSRSDDRSDD